MTRLFRTAVEHQSSGGMAIQVFVLIVGTAVQSNYQNKKLTNMAKRYLIGKLRTPPTKITTRDVVSMRNRDGKFIHGVTRKYPRVISTKTIPNE